MNNPKVVTAILNWNGKQWLEKFLPSVCATSYPNHHIVVIDNQSTDDSVEFLESNYPAIKLVINESNLGFAGGYTVGLQSIDADYFAILNSDVEVEKDWIDPLVARLEMNSKIAACQPKILSYHDKTQFEYAGASGGFIDRFGYPFCRGRIFGKAEIDSGQYDTAIPVFWASGAAFFVRASVFKSLGGFDPDFFAHMEEIDLCWRMQNAGHEIWVVPKSVVYHVGGATLAKENPHKTYLNFRNNLIMMSKNLPFGEGLIRIFIRMLLDGQAAIKELLTGNYKFLFAILRAHLHFYLGSFATIKKRKHIPQKRSFYSLHGVFKHSVVWWYFARNVMFFNKLPK